MTKWIVYNAGEYMQMNDKGELTRPSTGMTSPSGQWRITGAVARNNFGHVVQRYTLNQLKVLCNDLHWTFKNGKQRIFLTDFDHGTNREWGSRQQYVRAVS